MGDSRINSQAVKQRDETIERLAPNTGARRTWPPFAELTCLRGRRGRLGDLAGNGEQARPSFELSQPRCLACAELRQQRNWQMTAIIIIDSEREGTER